MEWGRGVKVRGQFAGVLSARDHTQVVRCGCRCPCLLSHVHISTALFFFYVKTLFFKKKGGEFIEQLWRMKFYEETIKRENGIRVGMLLLLPSGNELVKYDHKAY